ncbi:MAG: glycosyltransferase family 2 protein [Dysgonamonadaceae bacterium]|jgi:GT2 family glycosyltransferase|nr:glycosyltransferase family 2 protein [Dysgonamonadaceae bacterium]
MMKIAIIILNWNGRRLLEQYLPSVIKNSPHEKTEIIVADNGSTDDSIQFLNQYPDVRKIILDKNYGFAGGYNRAIAEVSNEYLVLLNSDVEVTEGWLTAADFLAANPEYAAVQPKILSSRNRNFFEYAGAAGGYIDQYGYPFCRGRVLSVTEKDEGQYNAASEIFWASGACMFIRRKDYISAGGFDEYFFAHQEEIDLCWRLRARGHKILCLPQSVVYHEGGATLAMENPRKTYLNFRNNLLMLYKNAPEKHCRKIFLLRIVTDIIAALTFLIKGYPKNALSVLSAYCEFYRKKKDFKAARQKNLMLSTDDDFPTGVVLRKCLPVEFYLKGRKYFSQIKQSPRMY